MAFSFPTSPTLNQEYSFGSKTWRYNGTGWILVTGVDAAQSAWSTANLAYINSNTATTLAQGAFDNSNTKFSSSGGTIGGSVTVTSNLTVLGNVTFVGNVTSLQVTGNSGQFFGYASNGFTALYAGIPIGYDFQPQTVFQTSANENGYAQINIQNINNGTDASGDYVATADNGTENDTYIDFGIGSSTHSDPEFTLVGPNDGYLYVHGNTSTGGGDLVLGTFLDNDVVFAAGGMNDDNEQMRIIGSSNTITVRANLDTSNAKSVLLGPVANIHISGGSDDNFIRTDGSGNLTFTSLASANVINVLYTKSNSSYIHANAAFDFANTLAGGLNTVNVSITLANDHANAAFDHANAAYQSQNATGQYANSAFVHANAAYDAANNALDTWVRGQANAAFIQANASFIHANSGFIHANAAFNAANNALDTWVRGQANAAFIQANSGFIHANAAFDFANTLSGGAAIDNVARITANAGFIHANAAYQSQNATGQYANAAFIRANNSLDANNGGSVSGTILSTANVRADYVVANTGFASAAGASRLQLSDIGIVSLQVAGQEFKFGGSGIEAIALYSGSYGGNKLSLNNETKLGSYVYDAVVIETSAAGATNQFTFANNSFTAPGGITANGFTAGGINVVPTLTSSFDKANAAFIRANNSLDANNGGTVTGDVRVTGNLTVTGTTTYVNTSTVLIADNIITLNAAIDQTSAPTVDAGIEVDRGNAANVYMLWNETEDRWTFTNDGVAYDGVGYSSTAPYANAAFTVANGAFFHANAGFSAQNTTGQYANSAFLQANAAFIVANAASLQANSAFFHANGAYQSQNATGQYANSAFVHANSAFDHANAAYQSQNTTGNYANSAFTVANGAFFHANAGFIIANVALLQANAAFEVANVAILQANSAFFHANGAFVAANSAGVYANGAFDAANSAGIYANSAYRHANSAFDHANSGFITANSAFIAANGALINAASAGAYANSAFLAANVADSKAVASGNYANAAFIRANNSLDANNGGSVTGTISVTGNVYGAYVVANSGFTSTAGGSKLELTDIGLVVVDVASQQFKFGAAGIESNPGIYGGAFGGNKLSLNNETNLISDRFDMVKIQTGENGTVKNEFTFANNAFTAPGRVTAISFVAGGPGGINIAPTLASSYNHANAAFDYANTATGAVVTFAAQPPASGNSNGHIWIDSADGTEYTYFKDSDTFQWVEFGPSSSNVSMNTYITADISAPYSQANAAFIQANVGITHAQSAFNQANTANGTITSDRLSSNLAINIIRVLETANIYSTAVGGNVNIDISNNTSYFFSSNTTANVTFNLRANGNAGGIYDSLVNIGQTSTVAIALKQGSTRYKANLYIDGVLQTLYWLGNSAPNYATTQEQAIDVYSFVVFKTAANTYSVLAANSNFGLAQGQPGQG